MSFIRYCFKILKKYPWIYIFSSLGIVLLTFFKIHEYALPLPAEQWINSNLENIRIKDTAHFSFAVFDGNRVNRHVFEGLLKQVDHDSDIAFVINLGDTVLKGKKSHYHQFFKQIDRNLGIPLLTVMGDKELSGDGRELYHMIFGPFYYSFRTGKNYFIVLDNVGSKGLDHKQMQWLENELENSGEFVNRIVFMHRPFYDPDENHNNQVLSEEISSKLMGLFLKYRVSCVFASHAYSFYEGKLRGIPYTVTGGSGTLPDNSGGGNSFYHFLKVNVNKDMIGVEIKKVFLPGVKHMNRIKYRAIAHMDKMIAVHWLECLLITVTLMFCIFYFIRKRNSGKRNED